MKTQKLVVFCLDDQQFALQLSNVERILPGMEIHPLPLAPEYIAGTINYQGEFLPVVNLRMLFMLPLREIDLKDQLIITVSSEKKFALWVDAVREIVELEHEEIIAAEKILLDVDYFQGLFKLRDGIVLIHDLERFLSPEQMARLEVALKKKMKDEGGGTWDEGRRTSGE